MRSLLGMAMVIGLLTGPCAGHILAAPPQVLAWEAAV